MNFKPHALVVLILLLTTFACQKDADIPVPVEPPPVAVENTAEVVKETPKPVVEPVKPPPISTVDLSNIKMEDVYFDFDKSELRDDTKAVLSRHAEVLKANSEIKVLVEGHCDERGTEDYNLGLGERRANRVREFYMSYGISADRIKTISYGELRPKAQGSNEDAWAMNRRAHFQLSK